MDDAWVRWVCLGQAVWPRKTINALVFYLPASLAIAGVNAKSTRPGTIFDSFSKAAVNLTHFLAIFFLEIYPFGRRPCLFFSASLPLPTPGVTVSQL